EGLLWPFGGRGRDPVASVTGRVRWLTLRAVRGYGRQRRRRGHHPPHRPLFLGFRARRPVGARRPIMLGRLPPRRTAKPHAPSLPVVRSAERVLRAPGEGSRACSIFVLLVLFVNAACLTLTSAATL